MVEVGVEIIRFVAKHQPNIVEARLVDAHGQERVFVDKCAIFTSVYLDRESLYPFAGAIACQVVNRQNDSQGQEIVTISTELPWHMETIDGETQFAVLSQQLRYTVEEPYERD